MRLRPVLLVGLAAGLLSGIFGVGGGVLVVPGLMLLAGMEQKRAHGTSLAAVVPIASTGLVTYVAYGNVDWFAASMLVVGALPGAMLGTRWLAVVSKRVLTWMFVVVALGSAVRLFLGVDVGDPGEPSVPLALGLVAVGLAAGILAGLLGVGGGIVMVPALMLIGGANAVLAKGTSLAAILPTGLVGTWRNRASANVDLRAAMTAGLAGAGTAVVGGMVAEVLPERAATVSFALLMLVVCARLVVSQRPRGAWDGGPTTQGRDK